MDKDVNFYKIQLDNKPITILNTTVEKQQNDLFEELYSVTELNKEYVVKENSNSNNIVALLDRDKKSLFGILTRREDLMDGVLRKITRQNTDQSLNDVYVDDFTYFYIDIKTLICAVLGNNKAPRFKYNFEKFINNTLQFSYTRVAINSILDDKIETRISEISKIMELELMYDSGSTIDDVLTLEQAFDISNASIVKAKIKLTVQPEPVSPSTRIKLLENFRKRKGYSKLDLLAMDEDENIFALDLVDGLLRKRIIIDIDKNLLTYTSDFSKIKDQLSKVTHELS